MGKGRQEKKKLVDRHVFLTAHAPQFPTPDPQPELLWEWCDLCHSWTKTFVSIPGLKQQDIVIRDRMVLCSCCAYRRRKVDNDALAPTVERCIGHASCPGDCGNFEIINALRRLAGLTLTKESMNKHIGGSTSFDLADAREEWLHCTKAAQEESCPKTPTRASASQ
jgi:hypothetical protein